MRVVLVVQNQLLRETLRRFLKNSILKITYEEVYLPQTLFDSTWDLAIADSAALESLKTQLNSLPISLLVSVLGWESSTEDLLNLLQGNSRSEHMEFGDLVATLPAKGQRRPVNHSPAFWFMRFPGQSLHPPSLAYRSL